MKIKLITCAFLVAALFFTGCDSSTSNNEVNGDTDPQTVMRARVVNTGDANAAIEYIVVITEPNDQRTVSSTTTLVAGDTNPVLLAQSIPGSTRIIVEVSILSGGPVRISIDEAESVSGSLNWEEVLTASGGSGQNITLEYTSN